MIREIPLAAEPAQSLQILLDDQECAISVYTREPRLYLDLDVDGRRICTGAVCLDGAGVLQSPTAYFSGSLHFVDTRGREAPQWDGLGTRWRLLWFSADEELPERLRY